MWLMLYHLSVMNRDKKQNKKLCTLLTVSRVTWACGVDMSPHTHQYTQWQSMIQFSIEITTTAMIHPDPSCGCETEADGATIQVARALIQTKISLTPSPPWGPISPPISALIYPDPDLALILLHHSRGSLWSEILIERMYNQNINRNMQHTFKDKV